MAIHGSVEVRMNNGQMRRLSDLIDGKVLEFGQDVLVQAREYTNNFKGHSNPDQKKRPTGNLKKTLALRKVGSNAVQLSSNCGYGAYVELGTSKMAAQPYFAPAIADALNALQSGGEWV